jgi:uncharacterized membrane protein
MQERPMPADYPVIPVRLSDLPAYALVVQFPVVCFAGALATDLAYWSTKLFLWETFSVWLLSVGCVTAVIAAVVGIVGFLAHRRDRRWSFAWPHALLSLLVLILSVVNAFVHSRDGYTAVVPDGLTLSSIVVIVMLIVAWMGWPRASRRLPVGAAA